MLDVITPDFEGDVVESPLERVSNCTPPKLMHAITYPWLTFSFPLLINKWDPYDLN